MEIEQIKTVNNDSLLDVNYKNTNAVNSRSCCGYVFTNWTQIPNALNIAGGFGIGIYEYIKKQYVVAIIATVMAVVSIFLHFVIAYFVPRRTLEQKLDVMKNNSKVFIEGGNKIIKVQDKKLQQIDEMSTLQGNLSDDIDKLKTINLEMSHERKQSHVEIISTENEIKTSISKDNEILKNQLELMCKKIEFLKKKEKFMKSIIKELKNLIRQSKDSNHILTNEVKSLHENTNKLGHVNDQINVRIQELKEESVLLKSISQKFDKISDQDEHKLESVTERLEMGIRKLLNEYSKQMEELKREKEELEKDKKNFELKKNEKNDN